MTIMTDHAQPITVGVDTHRDSHVAAALDATGGVLEVVSFPTTGAGYADLLTWARGLGRLDKIGVEGSGSWGVGLARHLRSAGIEVLEVCQPNRQLRRRRGKDDVVDAIDAARAVPAGEAVGPSKAKEGEVEAMRVLRVVRRSASKDRTAAMNQLRALVTTGPEELRARLRGAPRGKLLDLAGGFRPGDDLDAVAATKLAMRALARRVRALEVEISECDRRLHALVVQVAPSLLEHHAVGTETASALLVAAGDNPERLRSERAWARLCGVAPVPASSGSRQRHRLNRGGDRQANAALWCIVLIRMRSHQPTRNYVERRTTEGLSKREIMRCLKRYVARELYADLPRDLKDPLQSTI